MKVWSGHLVAAIPSYRHVNVTTRNGPIRTLIWPLAVNRRAGKTRGSALGFHCRQFRDWYFTPEGERDAREALATIDHADIRGLGAAFQNQRDATRRGARGRKGCMAASLRLPMWTSAWRWR
jgi:hypothetical protein